MEIPSHEELQRMSEAEIAELNFYLTVKKAQRLSVLIIVGGVVTYVVGRLIEQHFTKEEQTNGEQ